MEDVCIRPARLEDAKALQRNCYPEASFDDVRDYLAWCLRQAQKGKIVRLVAQVGDQAVANAQLTVWGETGEIGSLVVGQAFRRQGLARQLLAALIDEARQRGLTALEMGASEHQPDVLAFYQQMGFNLSEGKKERPFHLAFPEPITHLWMDL